MRRILTVTATLLAMATAMGATAAEFEVKMLNKGTEGVMVFEPALLKVQPGDTVRFLATDKSHNAESITTMLPANAKPFVGKMNEEVAVTFEQPGVYGIKCKPHYAMGMVGLVVVGTPGNAEEAKAITLPGRAKQVFAKLFGNLATSTTAAK